MNEPRLELLQHSWIKLHGLYEQLGELLMHSNRSKRGLFDGLGKVIKTITGNMDSDDQEYFDEKLNTLALDNKRIFQMEREQLTIIQSTLWAVNKTTSQIKDNQDLLAKSYKFLEKVIEYNQGTIQNLTLIFHRQTEILQEMSLMQELVHETNTMLDTLYSALDDARAGKLSALLIKPNDLLEVLENLKSHLHVGDSLPIPVSKDTIYSYYDIVSIRAYFKSSNKHCDLRLVISIPLNHKARNYHLFKVVQIPEMRPSVDANHSFLSPAQMYVFPQKTTDYIAFSENLQHYVIPSPSDLANCVKTASINICSDVHIIFPVNQPDLKHARCEVDLFRNVTVPNCNFRLAKVVNPVWERVPNTNTWFFSAVTDTMPVNVTCKNDKGVMAYIKEITLPFKGKLSLEKDCVATGSSFTLLARNVATNEITDYLGLKLVIPKVNITPSIEMDDIINRYANFTIKHKELVLNHVTHRMGDLNTASIRLQKLKELMDQFHPTEFDASESHHRFMQVLIIIILFVIVIIWALSKCGILRCIRNCVSEGGRTANVAVELGEIDVTTHDSTQEGNTPTESTSRIRRSLQLLRTRR